VEVSDLLPAIRHFTAESAEHCHETAAPVPTC